MVFSASSSVVLLSPSPVELLVETHSFKSEDMHIETVYQC